MRRISGISGAGAVLLAMLTLAMLIGIGSSVLETGNRHSAASELGANLEQIIVPTPTGESGAPIIVAEPTATTGPLFQSPANVSAVAVHVWRPETNEVLIDRSAGERMQVGSIVKVATAIVAMKHVELDESVGIDGTDLVDPAIYSNMALIAGDRLTVEQLLMGLLIASGGDASEALARHVGSQLSGSDDPDVARAAFVDAMNAWAAELGLADTSFANATGDDADGSYSTAHDVSIMAAELLKSPVLTGIVGMSSYEFTSEAGNLYTGLNTNALLGQQGVFGVKTGSTGDAGGCVVLARTDGNGATEIITILGSDLAYNELNQIVVDARWDDAQLLIQTIDS